MASLRQNIASRINGAKSKGPITPEGKARVAQNGTTHGVYSKVVVLQNEDYSLYEQSRDGHLEEWTPATPTEYNLVMDIVDARWRLRRFSTFETAALDFEVERMRPEVAEVFERIDEPTRATLAFNSLITSNRTFEVLQSAIRQQHRIINQSTNQLRRLRKDRLDSVNDDQGGGGIRREVPVAAPPAEVQNEAVAESRCASTQNSRTKPGEHRNSVAPTQIIRPHPTNSVSTDTPTPNLRQRTVAA